MKYMLDNGDMIYFTLNKDLKVMNTRNVPTTDTYNTLHKTSGGKYILDSYNSEFNIAIITWQKQYMGKTTYVANFDKLVRASDLFVGSKGKLKQVTTNELYKLMNLDYLTI